MEDIYDFVASLFFSVVVTTIFVSAISLIKY